MKDIYPAFDQILPFLLQREYLGTAQFYNIVDHRESEIEQHLKDNVRLAKIDEICFDSGEKIHLPGVESALTAMRNSGYSLLFILKGQGTKTSVYLGIRKNTRKNRTPRSEENSVLTDGNQNKSASTVLETYLACWKANFPGSQFSSLEGREIKCLSGEVRQCEHIGVLTGIPALKRSEESLVFVQGLERMIRALRGKHYCWISIADPLQDEEIRYALDSSRDLVSEIHTLVKKNLSKATAEGRTITMGMFGALGKGDALSNGESNSISIGGSTGVSIGWLSAAVNVMKSVVKSTTNTVTNSVNGGGFASFSRSLTKTTTVSEDQLNRKLEYTEEFLRKYEERFAEALSLGMWNVGHYFCSSNIDDFDQGCGILRSLFSGMDSKYEPPRMINLPKESQENLARFVNVHFAFPGLEERISGASETIDHPLGYGFNGPTTPLTTQELAIATPLARQDIEGVIVSNRASFGIHMEPLGETEAVSLGIVLDKGITTQQKLKLPLSHFSKHISIFGLTGSGKTTTVHQILAQLWEKGIPFMVIEPAKTEYRALAQHPSLKEDLIVITAGVDRTSSCPLRLNPFDFDPGQDTDNSRNHILSHIDSLKSTFNASFPMYASMPYILEEALHEVYRDRGWDLGRSINRFIDIYKEDFKPYLPTLRDLYLKVDEVVLRKGYYKEQQMNIQAALKARLSSLMVGAKGNMLNCPYSLSSHDLFEKPVIIELDHLGDNDEKAFLMGLLLSRLYEYRKSKRGITPHVGKPSHVIVIEEAHRLLQNLGEKGGMEEANVQGKAVSSFVDMLSEIRSMNESVMIVDQLPSMVHPNVVKGTATKIVHKLLAEDDRTNVGRAMGLTDDQIKDMGLLKTGECIVGMDGARKPYLCRIEKQEQYPCNGSGDLLPDSSTGKFKVKMESLLHLPSLEIDQEDDTFKESLHKFMLATLMIDGGILFSLLPTRNGARDKNWHNDQVRVEWLTLYWKQVSAEIWHYYAGEYDQFLQFAKAGEMILSSTLPEENIDCEKIAVYKEAACSYLMSTKTAVNPKWTEFIGIVYEQLILRYKVVTTINSIFQNNSAQSNNVERIAVAFCQSLESLIPDKMMDVQRCYLIENLAEAILNGITTSLNKQSVLDFVKMNLRRFS